jgi:hypothetical protein
VTGWRLVPVSVTGTDHLARGTENQDAFGAAALGDGFVAAVADGAGSASRSATGARLAVEAACDAARQVLGRAPARRADWPAAAGRYVRTVFGLFDARLAALAGADAPTDYATTLLAVVAHPPRYLYVSVGDGFLVVGHEGGGTHLVAPPDNGADRAQCVFLTSKERATAARVGLVDDHAVHGLALCTDGLLEAVLAADQWPDGSQRLRAPADFELYLRMFSAGGGAGPGDLVHRLQSDEFAASSPDDKTMLLAVHR